MALFKETERIYFSSEPEVKQLQGPDKIKSILQQIVDVHGSLHNSRNDCLKSCPLWFRTRSNTIKQLRLLAKQVETRKKNCDAIKLAGEAVSLIGDAVSVFGAILTALEPTDTSRAMRKKGQTGGLLGGVISAGACAYGSFIDNEDAKEVKRILRMDEEESAMLLKFRSTTEEFKVLVEEIMNFDVFAKLMNGFEKLKQEVRSSRNPKSKKKFQSVLPYDVLEMIRYLPVPETAKPNVEEFMSILCSSRECWNLFTVLIRTRKEDPLVFQAACLIGRLSLQGLQFLRIPVSSLSLTVLRNSITSPEGNAEVVTQGVISTASVAMDLMNIVDTSKEIIEETPSEFLKYLQQCLKLMQEELHVWKNIYFNAPN